MPIAGYYGLSMSLLALYWLVVVVAMVAQDREPATTLSWILILGLLPGVGLLIYFLGGRNWKGIHAKQSWAADLRALREPFMATYGTRYAAYSKAVAEKYRATPTERLIHAITAERGNAPLPANELATWPSGETYFPHLVDDISKARHFVHMQYY